MDDVNLDDTIMKAKPLKISKKDRIKNLELQVREARASLIHACYFAHADIRKASSDHLMGSGVILSLTLLGGREVFPPVLIRDGLSDETISAIRKDLIRSFETMTVLKPQSEAKEEVKP